MANRRTESDRLIINARWALAKIGIFAMHGANKGHGFWLYKCSPDLAAELTRNFDAAAFWAAIDKNGKAHEFYCIQNDGKKSGNPSFWIFKDAMKLTESAPS